MYAPEFMSTASNIRFFIALPPKDNGAFPSCGTKKCSSATSTYLKKSCIQTSSSVRVPLSFAISLATSSAVLYLGLAGSSPLSRCSHSPVHSPSSNFFLSLTFSNSYRNDSWPAGLSFCSYSALKRSPERCFCTGVSSARTRLAGSPGAFSLKPNIWNPYSKISFVDPPLSYGDIKASRIIFGLINFTTSAMLLEEDPPSKVAPPFE